MTETMTPQAMTTETAMTQRLLSLMRSRYPKGRNWLNQLEQDIEEWAPQESYNILSLCAAVLLVNPRSYGLTWEQIKEGFHTGKGDAQTRRVLKLMGRAMRLMERLLLAGCRKRGELQ